MKPFPLVGGRTKRSTRAGQIIELRRHKVNTVTELFPYCLKVIGRCITAVDLAFPKTVLLRAEDLYLAALPERWFVARTLAYETDSSQSSQDWLGGNLH